MTLTVGELFAGYGGLGRAAEEVFGARLAWYSEFDPAPSAIMAHHWPDVPNLMSTGSTADQSTRVTSPTFPAARPARTCPPPDAGGA